MRGAIGLWFAAVLIAGCVGGSGPDIKVQAPSQAGGAYTFHAGPAADNYTWDFGDHSPPGYGAQAVHQYAFPNGNLTVKLTTRSATLTQDYYQSLVLGDGTNRVPTFILDAPTNWTVLGEAFKISAAASSDPDHDPLLYSWSCLRERDIMRIAPHTHPPLPGGPGVNFASPPAGQVTARLATAPLPPANRTFTGDFCDALGTGTPFGRDATIAGAFTRTGYYTLTLLATDGKIPTTAGRWGVYVSTPGDRPLPYVRATLNATLQGGSGGQVQQAAGSQTGMVYDSASVGFGLPLAAAHTFVNVTYDSGPGGLNNVTWILKRGVSVYAQGGGVTPDHVILGRLEPGPYSVTVLLQRGAQVAVTVTVYSPLLMDPSTIY
ncbi:MAG: hypothetical protein ACYDBQ_03135 [Thermoplasmatota archaeon]